MAHFVPLYLVGANVDSYFLPNQEYDDEVAEDDLDDVQNALAAIVNQQFLQPFIQGTYEAIDPTNLYEDLTMQFAQYTDDNRMLMGFYGMAASLGARHLKSQLNTANKTNSEKHQEITDLNSKLSELEHELKLCKGDIDDMKQAGVKIDAEVSVQSVEILPMIAQVNIVLGWYYYLYGFNPLAPVDPTNYLLAKNKVIELGYLEDPTTGRFPAYDALMEQLKADKLERQQNNSTT